MRPPAKPNSGITYLIILTYLTIGSLTSSGSSQADEFKSESAQPNVLFIFADDYSYDSVHVTGNEEVKTPNLDELARSGTIFTHAYNMGAWGGAVCVASRTMLNTGRFVWNAQKLKLRDEQGAGRTWSLQMKSAGYETYFTGKWHVNGLKPANLFDHIGNVRPGMPNQTPEGYNRPIEGKPDTWSPYDKSKNGFWKGGKHWSEIVGDNAIGFLDNASKSENPFFMYIAFNAPHDPRQSPKKFVDMYPANKILIPKDFQTKYPYQDEIGCGKGLRDARLAPFPRTEHAIQVNRQEYYAIITHLDVQIGRILAALESSGKSDNTMVFFTADHGLAVGHHGLIGKQNMYDHSVRVPFFVKGPGVSANKQIDTRIYLQDVIPTTMQAAGIEKPDFVQFKGLNSLMDGSATKHYEAIYGGYKNLQRMITQGDMKLILYPGISKARLYNLKNDPLEMKDLADLPEQTETQKTLFAALLKLQKENGDSLDLKKAFPNLQ
ncbi:MAG: sulfatase-like hydrolase/transferase [Mariniblastus sp.]